jgi:hypothetical protein
LRNACRPHPTAPRDVTHECVRRRHWEEVVVGGGSVVLAARVATLQTEKKTAAIGNALAAAATKTRLRVPADGKAKTETTTVTDRKFT